MELNEESQDKMILDLGLALNPMTSVLRKTEADLIHRNTEEKSCEDRSRDWSDATTSQGCLELPEAGRGRKAPPPASLVGVGDS